MAVIETWVECDLQKPVEVHYLDGNLFSHNENANLIGAIVTNGGVAVNPLSGTVTGYAVLSDGTTVPCTGSKSGNKASVLLPAAAYLPGVISVSVFLTSGESVTTIAAVASNVLRTRTDTQVDPGSVVQDWTDTINAAMQDVTEAVQETENIIAVPYDELTFPVPLGAYTIYEHVLYRCINPISSSQSFTPGNWENKKVMDIISSLQETDIRYVPQSVVEAYGDSLADVAGHGNFIFNVRASQWDDEPFGGVGINTRYSESYDLQLVFSNAGNDIAYRLVNRTNNTVYLEWQIFTQTLNSTIDSKLSYYCKYEGISATDYSGKFANVAGVKNIITNIAYSQWDDVPFGGSGINMQYTTNYDLQLLFSNTEYDIAYRIVNRSTKEVYLAWNSIATILNNRFANYCQFEGIAGSDYSNTFANLAGVKNIITNIAYSQWNDVPFGGCGMNMQYTTNYDIQVIYALESNRIAYRFVARSNHAPYNGWHFLGGALSGKKVSIIGDSRSAYSGTVPSGNAVYYPKPSDQPPDLRNLSEMWWKRVIDWFGMTLVVNDSYSGGYVAYNSNMTNAAGILSSDTAINNLGTTAPDIILIFAGVNDWNGNANPLGEYDGTQTFPTTNTTFRDAMAVMLSKIQQKFPEADIWLCTNPYCCPMGTGSTVSAMPVPKAGNGGTTLKAFNDAIKDMANLFGCGVIDFAQCGVNWANLVNYSGDMGTTNGLHYNKNGHKLLADVAINTLGNYYLTI